MGRLICLFRACRWIFLFNAVQADDAPCGVYQCTTCKTVSVGSKRPFLAAQQEEAGG